MGVGGQWAGAIIIPYEACQNDQDRYVYLSLIPVQDTVHDVVYAYSLWRWCRCLGPSLPYAATPLGLAAGAVTVDQLWR